MVNTEQQPQVALLGAGPIGLAAALLLARAGWRVTVFDARAAEAVRDDRRLLALSRGSLQLLQPLLGARAPRMAPIFDVHVSSAGEFGTARIGAGDFVDSAAGARAPLGATVFYADLLAALNAVAGDEPGVEVRRPLRAAAVEQRADGVTLRLVDAAGAESTFAADLAVHAEGAPPADASEPTTWALIAPVQLRGAAAGDAFERFTREGPLALLPAPPTPGAAWSLVWCMDPLQAARRSALDESALRAELQQAIGPRLPQVTAIGERQALPLPQHARAQIAGHRVAWIGNAAQTLHPVAGQGLNLGLRDAFTLADAAARRRGDVPGALWQYAQRRSADRGAVTRITGWLPPLFASRLAPVALARSLGLTALDLLPPLRRQWARLLMFGLRH